MLRVLDLLTHSRILSSRAMAETFLILLAGGIMLAAAVSDPKQVTLLWLRLCGLLALLMTGLSTFFLYRRGGIETRELLGTLATAAAVCGQLAFVQIAFRRTQRFFALGGFFASVLAVTINPLCALGTAAMTGLVLMDMLLGHAYLTASKMTIAPFQRLNTGLATALILRAILAIPIVLILQHLHPVYMLWGAFGLFVLTRYLVGLAVPAVFVYMAHDCINRRSTQSATGILYVTGVLVFIGELIAVYLVRATRLPF